MRSINKLATQELETIRQRAGGFLKPEDIVRFAKNKRTALHAYFEWDDTEAAQRYRLLQAKTIIRVVVQVVGDTGEKVRTFVSLSEDRGSGLGYRIITDVMDDEMLTEQLLVDAKAELAAFSRKYHTLKKLAQMTDVFVAIDKAIEPAKIATSKEERPAA